MKIMAIAIALLVAGIFALAWQLNSEISAAHQLLREVDNLGARLADKSKRDAIASQSECASQAEKVFREWGWKLDEPTKGSTAEFQSHYNPEMNKCFIFVHIRSITSESQLTSGLLYDAFEQREYGELMITYPSKVQHIATCLLMPLHADQRSCGSEAEFLSFVGRYME